MHERSASRSIDEKNANFNDFQGLRMLAVHKSGAACAASIAAQHSGTTASAKAALLRLSGFFPTYENLSLI
jgi:hypothetical protein